jgi:hypothetical protein
MKPAHCNRDPAPIGACGGEGSCSCECFGCMPENRPDYEPEQVASEEQVDSKSTEEVPPLLRGHRASCERPRDKAPREHRQPYSPRCTDREPATPGLFRE